MNESAFKNRLVYVRTLAARSTCMLISSATQVNSA